MRRIMQQIPELVFPDGTKLQIVEKASLPNEIDNATIDAVKKIIAEVQGAKVTTGISLMA